MNEVGIREWVVAITEDNAYGECVFYLKEDALNLYFCLRRKGVQVELIPK